MLKMNRQYTKENEELKSCFCPFSISIDIVPSAYYIRRTAILMFADNETNGAYR